MLDNNYYLHYTVLSFIYIQRFRSGAWKNMWVIENNLPDLEVCYNEK